MKTKPKLIRVLTPPVSMMMMQHQHQERRTEEERQMSAHRRASLDSALSEMNSTNNEKHASSSRDALFDSLVQNRPLAPLGFSPNTSPPGGGYKVTNLTLHPCKPLVTYVLSWGTDDGSEGSGSAFGGTDLPDQTWVIVQDTKTRSIVFSMTLGELAIEAASVDNSKDNPKSPNKSVTITPLGSVEQLVFHDQSTLYWTGFTGDKDGSNSTSTSNQSSWSYLMVHCANRILVVDLQTKGGFSYYSPQATASVVADITPTYFFRLSSGKEKVNLLPAISANAMVATGRTRILLAFADGSLKVYDWKTKAVTQAARWSSTSKSQVSVKGFTDNPKTTDYVVTILPANPYVYNPKDAMGGADSKNSDGSPKKGSSSRKKRKRQLVLCITKKSVAYLCDLNEIDTKPPLAKMEVDFSSATSENATLARYDAFRDLFFWASPTKSHKSKIFVWDLSIVMNYLRDVEASWGKQKTKAPTGTTLQPDPVLITQLPYEMGSHSIFPGWVHKAFSSDSVACLVVTKDGDLQVSVSPLYNTGSTLKNPFSATTILSVKLSSVMVRDLELGRDSSMGDGDILSTAQPRFKVQSVHCSAFQDPSVVFVGSSIGIQMIQLLDGLTGISSPGTRYVYFNANRGNMGKSVLSVQGSQLSYSPLDPPPNLDSINESASSGLKGIDKSNPIGKMEYHIAGFSGSGTNTVMSSITKSATKPSSAAYKVTSVVYESPPPLHLPVEIRNKRSVRIPPQFLKSPSGKFVCCLWTEEMRYEVLKVSVLLESVTDRNRNGRGKSPLVASGTGVASFAWVGDNDVFCLLYDPEQDEALKAGINLGNPEALRQPRDYATMKDLGKAVKGTAGKLTTIDGLRDLGKDTGKLGKKGLSKMAHSTATVVAAPIKVSVGAGKIAIKGAKKGTKKVSKKMPFNWGRKKDKKSGQALAGAGLDVDDDEPTIATSLIDIGEGIIDPEAEERAAQEQLAKKAPWVELRMLISTGTELDETAGSGTTVSSLGQLSLRSGNRNPPTILFGGPVLCVGSKFDETDEGFSYFYTRKKGQEDESASVYVSSGPAFPCPDIVTWDDDGKLCAIAIKGRVSMYLSEEPNFVLLGTVAIGTPSASDSGDVISLMFLHGVLYCTTKTSVKCVFLGDLAGDVCHLDTYTLASSSVPVLPSSSVTTDYDSLTPPTIPMPLHHPKILGYQNGSLLLSTTVGVVAIPLEFPLLRIGALLSAGPEHHQKAAAWFEAVPTCDHEALAQFLDRRGVPGMALRLEGISLETTIDICMRYGYVDRLEEVVELYGLKGLRAIDCSRGFSGDASSGTVSLVVCVGAYLLGFGRVELVRRLATECLASGVEGKQEAFLLAGLLLSINEQDSRRVIQRSVEDIDEGTSDWVVGPFVRKHIL